MVSELDFYSKILAKSHVQRQMVHMWLDMWLTGCFEICCRQNGEHI